MSGYAAILIYLVVALVVAAFISFSSQRLGPRAPGGLKKITYESGILPEMPVTHFSVRFYRVAMLYLVFDVSVMALYPWATSIQSFHQAGFDKALAFLAILAVAFAYVWRRGGFTWD
jgi:NADH:ubiquinone oxidoreductase subunit 3 (subunit A)